MFTGFQEIITLLLGIAVVFVGIYLCYALMIIVRGNLCKTKKELIVLGILCLAMIALGIFIILSGGIR